MTTSTIPQIAIEQAISAVRYFEEVSEGCDSERLYRRLDQIKSRYELTDDQITTVEQLAYDAYYKSN